MQATTPRQTAGLVAVFALLLALVIYHPVGGFAFLNWDDDIYLQNNPHLQKGLSAAGVEWAFTANLTHHDRYAEYWSPLTLLTRLAEAQFFGVDAGAMHLASAALHALNAVLLWLALQALTGSQGRSAVVALLWLVHPQNIEPVAWLSARKDLVAATFFFLTLLAYAAYARRPTRGRYAVLLLAFLGALMAKPMAVTIPPLLLVLDWWPLRRAEPWARLVAEKIPLFLLSALAAGLAVYAQVDVGAMASTGATPWSWRLSNALWATATYVRRAVWPGDLCIFYPHTAGQLGAGTLLLCASVLAFLSAWAWRKKGAMLAGWLWFLGGLVPVIGLVQVGRQAMADRYFYTTGIGLLVAAVWATAALLERRRGLCVGLFLAALLLLTGASAQHIRTWRDSESAFRHALAVTQRNDIAHGNLGSALFVAGRLEEAREQFRSSLEIQPLQFTGWNNLGAVETALGRDDAALHAYERAVVLDPNSAKAHYHYGLLLQKKGRTEEARAALSRAAELAPRWRAPREALDQ